MEKLSEALPEGAQLRHALRNTTRFVSASMHDVVVTLAQALRSSCRRLHFCRGLAHDDISDHCHPVSLIRDPGSDGMLGFS